MESRSCVLSCTAKTDIDTQSLTGTDTKSTGEKKKITLTQRLHIAQANLHITSQRPLVGLELPVFYEWWSRGGVQQLFGFMLHEKQQNINPTSVIHYDVLFEFITVSEFQRCGLMMAWFFIRAYFYCSWRPFVSTWTAFTLCCNSSRGGNGGNPELKETQLKRGEEDNMIHHI